MMVDKESLYQTPIPFHINQEVCIFNLVGPTGTGKTHFVNAYLRHHATGYDYIYALSPTVKIKDDLFKGIPLSVKQVIHKVSNVSNPIVEKIFDSAYNAWDYLKHHPNPRLVTPDVLLICDDCLDSGILARGGACDRCAQRGRQTKIHQIYTSQGVRTHSNNIRDNATYHLLWSPHSVFQMEAFLEQFVSRQYRKQVYPLMEAVYAIPHAFILIDEMELIPAEKLKWSTTDDMLLKGVVYRLPLSTPE